MSGGDHVSVRERERHEAMYPSFYDSSDDETTPSPQVSFVSSSPSSPSLSPER